MTALNSTVSHDLLASLSHTAFRLRRPPAPARPVRPQEAVRGKQFFKYLPEDSGNRAGATVLGAGIREVMPGEDYSAGNHPNLYNFKWCTGRVLPEYQIIYLHGAHGEFESPATGVVRFHGDALIFAFPGTWHRFRPVSGTGWTERWVSLGGTSVAESFKQGGITPQRAIATPREGAALQQSFDELLQVVQRCPSRNGRSVAASSLAPVFDAIRQSTDFTVGADETSLDAADQAEASEPIEDDVVRTAIEIIWNDTHSPPLAVANVARKLPVTRRTLDRRFSESLGRSVLDEINACRFARAKRLLLETDLPVKTVSYLSGFPSRERMRIMFIEKEGLPPRDFRDQVRDC